MRLLLVLSFLALFSSHSYAQAFGTWMGMTIEDFGDSATPNRFDKSGRLFVVRPPDPNPNFERYFAEFGDLSGLCSITGISPTFTQTGAVRLRQQVLTALEDLYGPAITHPNYLIFLTSNGGSPVKVKLYTTEVLNVMVEYHFANYATCEDEAGTFDRTGL